MRLYRINENEFINLDEVVSIGIYNEATAINNKTGWTLRASFEGASGIYSKIVGTYGTKEAAQAAFTAFAQAVAGNDVTDFLSLDFAPVTGDNEAARAANTAKISGVSIDGNVISITLSCKVSELNDFDGRGGWGTHKWLGIGLGAGIDDITDLVYNGSALSAEDVTEATNMGLSEGYFVRWVAADLVLAGDDTQASKGTFTLSSEGYAPRGFVLRIIEG